MALRVSEGLRVGNASRRAFCPAADAPRGGMLGKCAAHAGVWTGKIEGAQGF